MPHQNTTGVHSSKVSQRNRSRVASGICPAESSQEASANIIAWVLTNTASVGSDSSEPFASDNTATVNQTVSALAHNDLTIEGYSRAAVQTYWRIPELKIGFDLGAQPWSFMSTATWFVSHTHLDHLAALAVYVARRRMM